METPRADLKDTFSDGQHPFGIDFANLIDSFVNINDDNIIRKIGNTLVITLGDVASGPPGTLRFSAGKVQYFDGTAWQDVGTGSGGGFTVVPANGSNPEVLSYNKGNVR